MPETDRFAPRVPWVLFLMTMVFYAIFPRLLLAPLLLRIATSLDITYNRASGFFLSASLGFVTGLLSSGYVSKWLTHRWTIVAGTGLAGVSMLLLSGARGVVFFHAMIFLVGWFNGLYPGSGIASVSALVPDHHRGKALALHESGPNLAFILAPLVSAAFAPSIGWRGVFIITGATAVVAALSFVFFGKSEDARGEPPHLENLRYFFASRDFWVVAAFYIFAATAAIGIYSVLPTYLIVEHGHSESLVNTLVGFSRVTGFIAIFSAGALSDAFGFRVVVATIIGLTGLMTVLVGVAEGVLLLVVVFMQPLVIQSFFPVGVKALTLVSPPPARNLSVSLAVPMANLIGAGIAPRVFAALGSAGRFGAAFVGLGVVLFLSLPLLLVLRKGPLRSSGR